MYCYQTGWSRVHKRLCYIDFIDTSAHISILGYDCCKHSAIQCQICGSCGQLFVNDLSFEKHVGNFFTSMFQEIKVSPPTYLGDSFEDQHVARRANPLHLGNQHYYIPYLIQKKQGRLLPRPGAFISAPIVLRKVSKDSL